MRLYGFTDSGNCYKPQLLMHQLGIAYDWVEVDVLKGESRTAEFTAKNANGRIPLLEPAPGRFLAESNAMLCFLADGHALYPAEPWARAKTLEWLFFEQYSHEPYIATVRFWQYLLGGGERYAARIAEARPKGYAALAVMERTLAAQPFLVDSGYGIADIALYAYTHVADEGGFELDAYPAIRAWLERVRAHPGHVPMGRRKVAAEIGVAP